MPSIHQRLVIGAPAATIYNAITSQAGLAAWWTRETMAKPETNTVARFAFGQYFKEMKIVALKPGQQVMWTCIAGAGEWVGTSISFTLEGGDRNTLLKRYPEMGDQIQQQKGDNELALLLFAHDDWKAYTPMFAECSYTWGRFLRSLKLFCETGKGTPWPHQHHVAP
jgi:uncharacterized protein YndB with AHSA1/START domain